MFSNAQCAPMVSILISMFLEVLAIESRMVVHVTVPAIEALIFGKAFDQNLETSRSTAYTSADPPSPSSAA